ncbi:MAG: hypothetical protein OEZ68_01450 [Gammaproteobacteria bacterium]|nr:hypothetical protein [Gammaproteobacteria bacterium]MDH5799444.1 hypothetical protein [Gammaproteobacteria bacterium]
MDHKICKHCGYTGKARNYYPNSALGYIAAILITMLAGLYLEMLYITIVPFLAALLHMAKFKGIQCPKCDSLDMVSLRSAEARLIFTRATGQPKVWSDGAEFIKR